eukprot:NODE_618_length_5937_cov_0.118191.p1 type:complete len:690 gc:universal NODE_618_length_5937_cov_0.118191:2769-4838(+)
MVHEELLLKTQDILQTKLDPKIGIVKYILKPKFLDNFAKKFDTNANMTYIKLCHSRGIEFINETHLKNKNEEIGVIMASLGRIFESVDPVEKKRSSATLNQHKNVYNLSVFPVGKKQVMAVHLKELLTDEKDYLLELTRNLNQLDLVYSNNPIRSYCKHIIRHHSELYDSLKHLENVDSLPKVFRSFANATLLSIYCNYAGYYKLDKQLSSSIFTFMVPLNRFEIYSKNMLKLYYNTKNPKFRTLSKELKEFQTKITNSNIKSKLSCEKEKDLVSSTVTKMATGASQVSNNIPNCDALIPVYGDFIAQGAVWEVLNSNAIKERTLYLYSSALIVAKDLNDGTEAFETRSCLALKSYCIKANRNIRRPAPRLKKHVIETIKVFNDTPIRGIEMILNEKQENQPTNRFICTFLHKTPGLDKLAVVDYLCTNDELMELFMNWFDTTLENMRIDLALRLLLSQVTLPLDASKMQKILDCFSKVYLKFNPMVSKSFEDISRLFQSLILFDKELDWSIDEFAVNLDGYANLIDSDTLNDMYVNLQENALFIEPLSRKRKVIDITSVPEYLIMDEMVTVSISIPDIDHNLKILVVGQDMIISPSLLEFDQTTTTFTIFPSKSGRKKIFFVAYGNNAPIYEDVGPHTITVEREFMKNTFLLQGMNEAKNCKFLFAVATSDQKIHWIKSLESTGLRFK